MGVRACLKMSMAFAVCIGILLIVFGTFFLELFVGADAEGAADVISYGHTFQANCSFRPTALSFRGLA